MTKNKKVAVKIKGIDNLFEEISQLIQQSRYRINTSVNLNQLYTNYYIGKIIVEDEQGGEKRAEYGKNVLQKLADRLTGSFGKGFQIRSLELMRKFYIIYSKTNTLSAIFENSGKMISSTLLTKLTKTNTLSAVSGTTPRIYERLPLLNWSHYVFLMGIDNESERQFYETEAFGQNWSYRELKRQFNSSLYERLKLSRNKQKVNQLAKKGQIVDLPQDFLKEPLVLEFLQLKELPEYSETDLEKAIIDKLQEFMMELGKGFLFEARQKRVTIEDKHHHIDLTFYNRILKCFLLIDLKIGELTHEDLGQMQMYVNYYDRYVKEKNENKTIGIVLCKKKNEALVEITLPLGNKQIYASKYQLYLPDKKQLKQILHDYDDMD